MVIVKSEQHAAVLLRIHSICDLTLFRFVCVCVCVCVCIRARARWSRSFEGTKCLLGQR
jgi:hypothetical protein